MMMSKLKILKNTIDIIDESIVAIKYQTTFVQVSQEAQVMIETYREPETHEVLQFSIGQRTEDNHDEENEDESSDDRNNQNNSSFNLKSLNVKALRRLGPSKT
jgi:hypothetical protein